MTYEFEHSKVLGTSITVEWTIQRPEDAPDATEPSGLNPEYMANPDKINELI